VSPGLDRSVIFRRVARFRVRHSAAQSRLAFVLPGKPVQYRGPANLQLPSSWLG